MPGLVAFGEAWLAVAMHHFPALPLLPSRRGFLQTFFGRHRLRVTGPTGLEVSREISWERGKENRFEIAV